MFGKLGPLELLIILALVTLLFGVGRISKIAGEFGKGIRSFKDSLKGNQAAEEKNTVEKSNNE